LNSAQHIEVVLAAALGDAEIEPALGRARARGSGATRANRAPQIRADLAANCNPNATVAGLA